MQYVTVERKPSVSWHSMNAHHQRPRSPRNRDKRVVAHLPLVRSIASRLRHRVPQIEMDDLVSAGTIGLLEAADRFDHELGVQFTSFAYPRINGAIVDEIRRFLGPRSPALGSAGLEPLSLEAPMVEGHGLTLMDVTANRLAPEPERSAELAELVAAIQLLSSREPDMLGLSVAGHSVTEIAQVYGCSQSLASQVLVHARFRLEERTVA
jgi:RNA polymerase sigma factor (sigma-70 family)